MKKHTVVLIVFALLVAFVAFWVFGTNKASAPAEKTSATVTSSASSAAANCPASEQPTITYQNAQFTPNCVTVKSGTVVTWVNKDSSDIQLGADPHPSHTGNREVTGGQYTLTLPAGGQVTSTLTSKGTHGYHNHLNPSSTGSIIVN